MSTFFEASRFGCRKMIFDEKKVTYNTYSCVISGISREMMKMDGRDSAECHLEFVLNDNKTKVCIVLIFSN